MPEHVEPLIEMRLQLILLLFEFRQFYVNKFQLVVENLAALVFQFYGVQQLFIRFVVIEDEIEDSDGVNSLQFVIPIPFFRLLLDGKRGVVNASVFEKILLGFLNFDDESFAGFANAVEIEYGFAIQFVQSQLLIFGVTQIPDPVSFGQDLVEKVN